MARNPKLSEATHSVVHQRSGMMPQRPDAQGEQDG
jgi:hypothetical protein